MLTTANTGLIPSSFFRGNNSESPTTIPKAYINYIFFDEQFKYAGVGGASRVGTSGSVKDHWNIDAQLQNILVPKNGYIFVYVSNESNLDVFFEERKEVFEDIILPKFRKWLDDKIYWDDKKNCYTLHLRKEDKPVINGPKWLLQNLLHAEYMFDYL